VVVVLGALAQHFLGDGADAQHFAEEIDGVLWACQGGQIDWILKFQISLARLKVDVQTECMYEPMASWWFLDLVTRSGLAT
jgi:hypothetical protein